MTPDGKIEQEAAFRHCLEAEQQASAARVELMASEYMRRSAHEAALNRWLAAKLGVEAAHEDTPVNTAQMTALRYTHNKPTQPGWYWCRHEVEDSPTGEWEAVVRIDKTPEGLICVWMRGKGKIPDGTVGILNESEWAPETQWMGPLQSPQ